MIWWDLPSILKLTLAFDSRISFHVSASAFDDSMAFRFPGQPLSVRNTHTTLAVSSPHLLALPGGNSHDAFLDFNPVECRLDVVGVRKIKVVEHVS